MACWFTVLNGRSSGDSKPFNSNSFSPSFFLSFFLSLSLSLSLSVCVCVCVCVSVCQKLFNCVILKTCSKNYSLSLWTGIPRDILCSMIACKAARKASVASLWNCLRISGNEDQFLEIRLCCRDWSTFCIFSHEIRLDCLQYIITENKWKILILSLQTVSYEIWDLLQRCENT